MCSLCRTFELHRFCFFSALSAIIGTGHFSSAGWTNSAAVLKLSVSVCVLTRVSQIVTAVHRDLNSCMHRRADELWSQTKNKRLCYTAQLTAGPRLIYLFIGVCPLWASVTSVLISSRHKPLRSPTFSLARDDPLRISRRSLPLQKLEWFCYLTVKTAWM